VRNEHIWTNSAKYHPSPSVASLASFGRFSGTERRRENFIGRDGVMRSNHSRTVCAVVAIPVDFEPAVPIAASGCFN
jgi:hypothetical protein